MKCTARSRDWTFNTKISNSPLLPTIDEHPWLWSAMSKYCKSSGFASTNWMQVFVAKSRNAAASTARLQLCTVNTVNFLHSHNQTKTLKQNTLRRVVRAVDDVRHAATRPFAIGFCRHSTLTSVFIDNIACKVVRSVGLRYISRTFDQAFGVLAICGDTVCGWVNSVFEKLFGVNEVFRVQRRLCSRP